MEQAIAAIEPTHGNAAYGTVRFVQSGDGLDVRTELDGLTAGAHAHHVHLFGDCSSPDGQSAGTHLDFACPPQDPTAETALISGDLGDVTADASGHVAAKHHVDGATLSGRFSILGRAGVVHAEGNDPRSPPMGAAGGRIGCGVIGISG